MKARKFLALVLFAALTAGSSSAQVNYGFGESTNLAIPPAGSGGAAGGASNPANVTTFTTTVMKAVTIVDTNVGINLIHGSVGDLRIEVEHCGVSVQLYNQSPANTADLNGYYHFHDPTGSVTFAWGINAAGPNGVVAPITYTTSGLLNAFNGMSSAGQWTVKIYDLAPGNVGQLLGLSLNITAGASHYASAPPTPITSGMNGQCLAPVTHVVNVPTHGPVAEVIAYLVIAHTYAGDLDITVTHAGVSVMLSAWGAPNSSANLSGTYGFSDSETAAWTATELLYSGTQDIPSGLYRPKEPLSAFIGLDRFGPWYVTVCDRSSGDVGTLNTAWLTIIESPYDYTITQPSGSAALTLTNTGGVPGHLFVNLFTLVQGTAPYGWLGGLDIAMSEVISQVSFGVPFMAPLDSCGSRSITMLGPIPTNLTVWTVGIELDQSGSPCAVKPAWSYTTAP